jgi:hypothetical protein
VHSTPAPGANNSYRDDGGDVGKRESEIAGKSEALRADRHTVHETEKECGKHNAANTSSAKNEGSDCNISATRGDVVDVLAKFANRQVSAREPA